MKKTFELLLVSLFLINCAMAQESTEYATDTLHAISAKRDTFCFKYTFYPKDTLIYKVSSLDSILQGLEEPFFKEREEKLQVVCDSVDKKMNYYLHLELLESETKEWSSKEDTVRRNSSVWIGKQIYLVIDSLGNRLKERNSDTTHIASTLGGIFQPYLFFPLKENCKKIKQSWLIKTQDTLFENAYPPGSVDQTSLFRLKDTLNSGIDSSLLITFVKTAKGYYGLNNSEFNFIIDAKINSYGELILGLFEKIPKDYTATQELKMQMKYPDGKEIPIWQYTTIRYTILQLKRSQNEPDETINQIRR